jgi:hypothetical protein
MKPSNFSKFGGQCRERSLEGRARIRILQPAVDPLIAGLMGYRVGRFLQGYPKTRADDHFR